MVAVVAELLHRKVYGPTPVVPVAVMLPLAEVHIGLVLLKVAETAGHGNVAHCIGKIK